MENMIDKYKGCMVGLLAGDCMCAPCEGGVLEKGLWWIIGKSNGKRRYTDDTQMALDLARHLIKNGGIKQQELAVDFCRSYKWSRGYGPGTVSVLRQIRSGKDWKSAATHKHSNGSYGNGAAMRIAPVALWGYGDEKFLDDLIVSSSEVTHLNDDAISGARLIAAAIVQGLGSGRFIADGLVASDILTDRFISAINRLESVSKLSAVISPGEVRRLLGVSTASFKSCIASLYVAEKYQNESFGDMIAYVNKCGGDTDTIGAMAGSIWGAVNGMRGFSDGLLASIEGLEDVLDVAVEIHRKRT